MTHVEDRQQRLIDSMTNEDIDSIYWVRGTGSDRFSDRAIARMLINQGWAPPSQHAVLVADHEYFDNQEQELADRIDELEAQLERLGAL